MKNTPIRINISMNTKQLKELERAMKKAGFTNRSEFIRHLVRKTTQ